MPLPLGRLLPQRQVASGARISGGTALDTLQLYCIRVDVASFLPLRRELGAALGYGWRLLGYLCWLSAAGLFGSHAPSAFAGCRLRLACEGGLLSAVVEQNKNKGIG